MFRQIFAILSVMRGWCQGILREKQIMTKGEAKSEKIQQDM